MTRRGPTEAPLALLLALACGPPHAPSPVPAGWVDVTRLLDSVIGEGAAPGAVLAVSVDGRHYFYGTGRLGQDDAARPDSATIYDLASLTKTIGLTTLTMQAVAEERLDLDASVARYLPSFHPAVTIRQLLTHSSGLPAWRPLYQETATRREAIALADTTPLTAAPGSVFVYSDLGAIVLTQVIEKVLGARIDSLFHARIAGPLQLHDTRYLPPAALRPRIAPTENDPWRGRVLRGEVHDENAARLDGVSGHAGLFSSARDLVRFGDWLVEQESADTGAPAAPFTLFSVLPAALVRQFTTPQGLPPGSSRALGWDTPSEGSSGGNRLSPGSFGHTGFTGTSIWIDPVRRLVIVLLSNRVHPTRDNPRWGPVRALVADRVVAAFYSDTVSH